jgi:enoyl-CoA hydratase/carnithine racemase
VTYETLIVTVEAGVGQILLNRPEQRNALNHTLLDELNAALVALDADEDVRAIVVSGAGRVFCSGLDVSDPKIRVNRDIDEATEVRAWELDTPIVGALNGAAIGVGLTLPLQWDIRIAAEDAPLSFAFSRLGLIPEAGSHWFLPRLVGSSIAAELLLTGATVYRGRGRDDGSGVALRAGRRGAGGGHRDRPRHRRERVPGVGDRGEAAAA